MARSLTNENILPLFVGSIILSITCSNATEVAPGQLPVAVDYTQLRTMAPVTVYPIDWSLPSTL